MNEKTKFLKHATNIFALIENTLRCKERQAARWACGGLYRVFTGELSEASRFFQHAIDTLNDEEEVVDKERRMH